MTKPRTESAVIDGSHVLSIEGFIDTVRALKLHDLSLPASGHGSDYMGRGGIAAIGLPDGGGRALVRRYRHGGISGLVFGSWFAGTSRAVREFEVTLDAFSSGVPCAQPLAAVTRRTLGLFYRASFVSLEIPGSQDLAAMAKRLSEGSIDCAQARGAAAAAARSVAAMHAAGFLHADLNMKNIVVSPEGGGFSARIVDFDLSRRAGKALSRDHRMLNLMRLERSARKFGSRGLAVPVRIRLRFLREYVAASGMERPSRSEIRSWSRALLRHSFAWIFFR